MREPAKEDGGLRFANPPYTLFRIFDGTTEIQKLIIARDLLRQYQADAVS
jgi:hypothetical protein